MRDKLLRHSISMQECSDLMVPARLGLIDEINKKCEDIQDGAEKAEWEERYYLSDSIDDISDSEYKRLNKKLVNNQQFYDYLRSFNKPGYYNIQILVNLICDKNHHSTDWQEWLQLYLHLLYRLQLIISYQ